MSNASTSTTDGAPSGLVQSVDRALNVLGLLAKRGELGVTEIAQDLHMSVKTVSTHKSRIQEKLQLPSLAALIRYGIEHKLDKND